MPDEPATDPAGRAEPPGGGWPAYYRATIGREPRPLFWKGIAALEGAGMQPGQAVEIGFGDGTETLALLAAGWRVVAIDPAPAAADTLRSQVTDADADRLEILSMPAERADLPPFDLLYAGYSLPFLDPTLFDRFWAGVRERLLPGGFLVVNFFGTHDSWFGREGMSFIERETLGPRLDGLEVIAIDEQDTDGESFLGPKHWHVFDVVARRPVEDAH